jgi:glycine/D-amino acid oxidase-like deaminating enzyme
MRVVICGGGAIGTSIAYFLSDGGAEVVLVERTGVACAASGKSGGFLAEDWCAGSALDALARRSFALHANLADALGGVTWNYRRMDTYGGWASARDNRPSHSDGRIAWLDPRIAVDRRLGSTETTAQVHPARYCQAMMRAAEMRGASLRLGEVTGLVRRQDGSVRGVEVDGSMVEADAVVIAMGPWSILASRWLRLPGVYGLKGHSVVFDTGSQVPADAMFLEFEEASGEVQAPEVFPRSDGTTYICAISSQQPLPLDPADVAPDEGAIERLTAMCRRVSPVLALAPVVAAQACFRPVTQDGLPLIGALVDCPGAYIATGHSVWGMLNAPATGEAMAELILGGAARPVDLAPFRPERLPAFDPRRLR